MPPRRKYPTKRSAATSARYAKRRQNRLARVDNDLTDAEWQSLLEAWGGCAYCQGDGAALQRDCVQPISRGGRYTLGNVVPACASCNASKHNTEVTGWLRRKKLDERAFLLRHATILQQLLPADEPTTDPTDDHTTDSATDSATEPAPEPDDTNSLAG